VVEDISQKKKAEEALQESERALRQSEKDLRTLAGRFCTSVRASRIFLPCSDEFDLYYLCEQRFYY
jgi:hypothetical protein